MTNYRDGLLPQSRLDQTRHVLSDFPNPNPCLKLPQMFRIEIHLLCLCKD